MNERYIEINGNPTTMPLSAHATPYEISEFIRDYLRYKGDFAFNLVPVENDSIYPDGEYSEIRIVIKNTNEEPDESEMKNLSVKPLKYQSIIKENTDVCNRLG